MTVNVFFTGPIARITKTNHVKSSARDLRQLLKELEGKFGAEFMKEANKTRILVNGYAVQFYNRLATGLGDGDRVDFFQNWRVLED